MVLILDDRANPGTSPAPHCANQLTFGPMKLKMNIPTRQVTAACILLATLSNGLFAQAETEFGKFTGDFRARVESANQQGRPSSDALTLRSRIGFQSQDFEGFSFLIEGEDVRAADEDDYNPYPVPGKTVIADPEGTELNRAQISYARDEFAGTLGRQRIILDGARFVGNVGWRQNEQTYDAATLTWNDQESGFKGFYGYIDKVHRIFGDDAPASAMREFQSDSHLFNGSMMTEAGTKVTGYAYLLDFDNAAANSTDTFGISISGADEIGGGQKVSYYAEFASQSDGGNSPLNYSTEYYHVNASTTWEGITFKGGYEVLGSDNGVGFKTPLATLHAYNGWADAFLGTPGLGLQDLYVSVGTKIQSISGMIVYHDFASETGGVNFGHEIDLVITIPVNERVKMIMKAATLDAAGGIPDNDKFWFEADFSF